MGRKSNPLLVNICRVCANLSKTRKQKLLKCDKCGNRMLIVKRYMLTTIQLLLAAGVKVLYVENQDFTNYGQICISLGDVYEDIFQDLPNGYIYCENNDDIAEYFLSSPLVSIHDIDGDHHTIKSVVLTDNKFWHEKCVFYKCEDIATTLEDWLSEQDLEAISAILILSGRVEAHLIF